MVNFRHSFMYVYTLLNKYYNLFVLYNMDKTEVILGTHRETSL